MTTLYQKEDPSSIKQLFDSIANHYDRTNAILSFQLHKRWNRSLVKAISSHGVDGPLLDLCSGTGDIAYAYAKIASPSQEFHLLDFSPQMLEYAQKKRIQLGYPSDHFLYHQADAQAVPLSSESIAKTTIAYGIRNVKNPRACIQEVYRVLRPGGCFGILELTQPENIWLRLGHKMYLHTFLPLIGKWMTSNRSAYEYLCNSIQKFIKPKEIENLLAQTGFQKITITPLSGGIATLILAIK